jgi:hypothetical protein
MEHTPASPGFAFPLYQPRRRVLLRWSVAVRRARPQTDGRRVSSRPQTTRGHLHRRGTGTHPRGPRPYGSPTCPFPCSSPRGPSHLPALAPVACRLRFPPPHRHVGRRTTALPLRPPRGILDVLPQPPPPHPPLTVAFPTEPFLTAASRPCGLPSFSRPTRGPQAPLPLPCGPPPGCGPPELPVPAPLEQRFWLPAPARHVPAEHRRPARPPRRRPPPPSLVPPERHPYLDHPRTLAPPGRQADLTARPTAAPVGPRRRAQRYPGGTGPPPGVEPSCGGPAHRGRPAGRPPRGPRAAALFRRGWYSYSLHVARLQPSPAYCLHPRPR